MIAPENTVLILLAAGRSLRFGEADKLSQDLHGKPLAFHAVTALDAIPFRARIAITSVTELDFTPYRYRTIRNDHPEIGMSSSLKLGIAAARDLRADAAVIALADMPHIAAAHVRRLLDAADGRDAIVASSGGVRPSPPAVFGAGRFDTLLTLTGDEGARALIAGAAHVPAVPDLLVDIDDRAGLDRLRR